ncbi:MAG: hypothetical protein KGO82_02630 [Bacteroidota bacterium]|nr:hypothetical protein [Bacteroidota bacterium]
MKKIILVLFPIFIAGFLQAQDPATLIQKIREKLEKVNDYEASGEMKTNVSFMKVPAAQVKVFFKKPGKLKIKNEKGISLVPKGTVSISLNNLFSGKFQALDGGTDKVAGVPVRIVQLLPTDESSDIVLSKLYIDPVRLLVLKAKTTTRESGTSELEMSYGKYASLALPDKLVFTFNTQEYKLPKGVTFDYDDGTNKNKEAAANQSQKGKIEITYSGYAINKGIADEVFR